MLITVKKALTGLILLLFVFCCAVFVSAASVSGAVSSEQEPEQYNAYVMGDADMNGSVDAGDARAILCAALAIENISADGLPYADVHTDGIISAADARVALRTAVKLEPLSEAHSYSITVTDAATCTKQGRLHYTCSLCDASGDLTVPKNSHDYGSPEVTDSTCAAYGKKVWTCRSCGAKKETALPLKDHTWVNATPSEPKHCSVCGLTAPGWTNVGGKWHYFNDEGKSVTGKKIIDGLVYYFDGSGVSQTGKTGAAPKVAVLGDSVVVSIANSSAAPEFDFYGKVSLNTVSIFTKSISGSSRTVINEIVDRGYDIVILLIGINDSGGSMATWESAYRNLIKGVRERAPEALIIAHAILPINEAKARAMGYSVTMSNISARNDIIKNVASSEGALYVDATSVIGTENGQLPYASSGDGIHFAGALCRTWHTWITQQIMNLKG